MPHQFGDSRRTRACLKGKASPLFLHSTIFDQKPSSQDNLGVDWSASTLPVLTCAFLPQPLCSKPRADQLWERRSSVPFSGQASPGRGLIYSCPTETPRTSCSRRSAMLTLCLALSSERPALSTRAAAGAMGHSQDTPRAHRKLPVMMSGISKPRAETFQPCFPPGTAVFWR